VAKRKAVWARTANTNQSALTGAKFVVNLLTNLETNIGRSLVDVTVGRILFQLGGRSLAITGALDISYGVIPATEEAIAVAAGAGVPSPATNADHNNDWMLWGRLVAPQESFVPLGDDRIIANRYRVINVEVRSMRKLRGTTKLCLVLVNNDGSTVGFDVITQVIVML